MFSVSSTVMDKRRVKIKTQFKEIEEESTSIIDNLRKIVHEIREQVNNDCESTNTDMLKLINLQFGVLQMFSEINLSLESFIEEKNLSVSDVDLSNVSEPVANVPEKQDKSFNTDLPCTSSGISSIQFANTSEENVDITVLKDDFMRFTKKIGLNEQLLTNMQDFYNKTRECEDDLLPERDENNTSLKTDTLVEVSESETTPANSSDTEQENLIDLSLSGQSNEITEATVSEKLAKLNNISDESESLIDLPNHIKLKCPENVIKNDLVPTSKKKKNKNKKFRPFVIEITDKPCPTVNSKCSISHVVSPDEFYIQLADEDSALIDSMSDRIKESVRSTPPFKTKEEAKNILERYCVAFINSCSSWNRVEVLDWMMDKKSDEVYLQLIDIGTKQYVNYLALRQITGDLIQVNKLAVKCNLPLLFPPQSTHTNRLTEWPEYTIEGLIALSGIDQGVNKIFKICYSQKIGDSVAVELCRVEDDGDPSCDVGQILLDLDMAVQLTDNLDENNIELEQFVEDAHEMGRSDNINETVAGYDARDEVRICNFTQPDGTCFKGKHCKLEHPKNSRGGFTTDKISAYYEAMNDLIIPKVGTVAQLLITEYVDSCTFYAQLICDPMKMTNYFLDKDLYSLMERMNAPRRVSTYEKYTMVPSIGEKCIALHYTKKWLRGVVRSLEFNEDNQPISAEIFMLDFGDTLQIKMEKLRKMQPDFLILPFQVIQCYLYNVKEIEGVNKKKAFKFFQQNILFKNFHATVMSRDLPMKVKIVTPNGLDMGEELKKYGYATDRRSERDIRPRDAEN